MENAVLVLENIVSVLIVLSILVDPQAWKDQMASGCKFGEFVLTAKQRIVFQALVVTLVPLIVLNILTGSWLAMTINVILFVVDTALLFADHAARKFSTKVG